MRAVLDPNVIISALLSPHGSPAEVFRAWLDGAYDAVVSPLLLDELARALAYPKIRGRITAAEADEVVELLRGGDLRDDPAGEPPVRSPDAGDDYLISLAAASRAVIVSGDSHLLDLGEDLPVYSPPAFLDVVHAGDR